jgi:glycolate oxidase
MAGFDSVRDCAQAVADIIKNGVIPAGLEMMDAFAIEAAEDFAKPGYPIEAKHFFCVN